MNLKLKPCKAKKGFRIDLVEPAFLELKQKILKKLEPELQTPHMLIFTYKKTKISLTYSGLVLRNCSKKEAENILQELIIQ